jgi:hypothetical protein
MSFARMLTLGITAWVLAITLLHAWLNWGIFDPKPPGWQDRKKFRVGFLPVT